MGGDEQPQKKQRLEGDSGDAAAREPDSSAKQAAEAGGSDAPAAREPDSSAKEAAEAGGAGDARPEGLIEHGRLFALYRPKVTPAGAEPSVESLADVQRGFLILHPLDPPGKSRLIIIGKKKLPDTERHERFYAFVEAVADAPSQLTGGLAAQQYSTKTRGERVQPAARVAAMGPYVIAKGGKRASVHLAYKLELPAQPGEAQEMLNIGLEGSFVLNAKNPANQPPGAPRAGPQPPAYTEEQLAEFGSSAWIGVEDASLLNVPGAELLLVGARADPIEADELGAAGKLLERLVDENVQSTDAEGQAALLKAALEPETVGGGGSSEQQGEPIPVAPAVTGEAV